MNNQHADVERIVKGLTEKQREAFDRSQPGKLHPDWTGRISTWGDQALAEELYFLGLVEKPETFSFATRLGLAVRAALMKEKGG